MSKPYSFDLERAIAAWRQSVATSRAMLPEDLDELERHLRDEIQASSLPLEQAFREAAARIGPYSSIESEYRKVYWGKLKNRHRFLNQLRWQISMLRNYFTIAWRNVLRHKGYTAINVFGLAMGLAVCLLIVLFVRHELSYDQFFVDSDRMYRVVYGEERLATSGALAPALKQGMPEVEQVVRISSRWPEALVTLNGESTYEERLFFVDSTFFDVFSYPMIAGNPDQALNRAFTVVLTEQMADKYFPDQDPIGQIINLQGLWDAHDFEVTGVVENPPSNTHFDFNFLASFATRYLAEPGAKDLESWSHIGELTYVLLRPDTDIEHLESKMPDLYLSNQSEARRGRYLEQDLSNIFTFQRVQDIHLYSHLEDEFEPNAQVRYLYIFSIVALIVLLIACINYVNLATSRAIRRSREVGVRKVVGAYRTQLTNQFILESISLVFGALVIAVGLVWLGLPWLSSLLETELSMGFDGAIWLWTGVIVGGLALGALSGLYPALALSRFEPVSVLKGMDSGNRSGVRFRHALVVVQFVASVVLILGTVIVQRQLSYLQEKNLGMNPDQVMVLSTRGSIGRSDYGAFKTELMKHRTIEHVSAVYPNLPMSLEPGITHIEKRPEAGKELPPQANNIFGGQDIMEALQLTLVEGRELMPSDYERSPGQEFMPVLVNEATIRVLGWEEAIGKRFECCFSPVPQVVGVVADFHYQSLKAEIAPLVIMPSENPRYIALRFAPVDIRESMDFIQETWTEIQPGIPLEITFMDDQFQQIYDAEERLANTFQVFTGLVILIACLGLFGLASYMAQQRTREIGIRKVLGAGVADMVGLMSRDFLKLIGIALLIGLPLAWVLSDRWLQDFPYRIELGAGVFIWTAIAVITIAMITVSHQAFRAAMADPVQSLRTE